MTVKQKLATQLGVGLVNTLPLDLNGNAERCLSLIRTARERGCRFVFLPELALTGIDCGDLFAYPDFLASVTRAFLRLRTQLPAGIIVGLGLPLAAVDGRTADAYVLLTRDGLLGLHARTKIPSDRAALRAFAPIPAGTFFRLDGQEARAARQLTVAGITLEIAYAVPERCLPGTELLVLPAAARFELGSPADPAEKLQALTAGTEVTAVTANVLGCDGGGEIYQGRAVIVGAGQLYARSPTLSFARAQLWTATDGVAPTLPETDTVIRAVGVGLFDWMIKTRSRGFALSLSGGADSALCAVCCAYAQLAAYCELGHDAYAALLARCGVTLPLPEADPVAYAKAQLLPRLLTTVYQASHVSGDVTRTAARELAAALGAKHYCWSVAGIIAAYRQLLDAAEPEHPLREETDDLTLQNIQARARAPGVWMLANREGKLLLATCNASEDAVGYCTMDGDTAGGLAPLGDLSKSRILAINRAVAVDGVMVDAAVRLRVDALRLVTAQAPTAELRPGQTDERDLMPYAILDQLHVWHQRDLLTPRQIVARLCAAQIPPDGRPITAAQARAFVRLYFAKLAASQWKRQRAAPAFHLEITDQNPGAWRLPILNDGMAHQLAEIEG